MRRFRVVTEWQNNYPDPLIVRVGEVVTIEEGYSVSSVWKGWTWCKTETNSGWLPEQIIEKTGPQRGVVTMDYSARELDALEGEEVEEVKCLNGWILSKKSLSEEMGWLPLEVLEEIV